MSNDFTPEELDFLLESVEYSKNTFQEYKYENEALRKIQLDKAYVLIRKIRNLKKDSSL